ncbi:hypothetical protein BgiMline_026005 [Biomphalaria glabrata]|nr:hypothetical protein BgiMline_031222 [Biomphalaria glabrata]
MSKVKSVFIKEFGSDADESIQTIKISDALCEILAKDPFCGRSDYSDLPGASVNHRHNSRSGSGFPYRNASLEQQKRQEARLRQQAKREKIVREREERRSKQQHYKLERRRQQEIMKTFQESFKKKDEDSGLILSSPEKYSTGKNKEDRDSFLYEKFKLNLCQKSKAILTDKKCDKKSFKNLQNKEMVKTSLKSDLFQANLKGMTHTNEDSKSVHQIKDCDNVSSSSHLKLTFKKTPNSQKTNINKSGSNICRTIPEIVDADSSTQDIVVRSTRKKKRICYEELPDEDTEEEEEEPVLSSSEMDRKCLNENVSFQKQTQPVNLPPNFLLAPGGQASQEIHVDQISNLINHTGCSKVNISPNCFSHNNALNFVQDQTLLNNTNNPSKSFAESVIVNLNDCSLQARILNPCKLSTSTRVTSNYTGTTAIVSNILQNNNSTSVSEALSPNGSNRGTKNCDARTETLINKLSPLYPTQSCMNQVSSWHGHLNRILVSSATSTEVSNHPYLHQTMAETNQFNKPQSINNHMPSYHHKMTSLPQTSQAQFSARELPWRSSVNCDTNGFNTMSLQKNNHFQSPEILSPLSNSLSKNEIKESSCSENNNKLQLNFKSFTSTDKFYNKQANQYSINFSPASTTHCTDENIVIDPASLHRQVGILHPFKNLKTSTNTEMKQTENTYLSNQQDGMLKIMSSNNSLFSNHYFKRDISKTCESQSSNMNSEMSCLETRRHHEQITTDCDSVSRNILSNIISKRKSEQMNSESISELSHMFTDSISKVRQSQKLVANLLSQEELVDERKSISTMSSKNLAQPIAMNVVSSTLKSKDEKALNKSSLVLSKLDNTSKQFHEITLKSPLTSSAVVPNNKSNLEVIECKKTLPVLCNTRKESTIHSQSSSLPQVAVVIEPPVLPKNTLEPLPSRHVSDSSNNISSQSDCLDNREIESQFTVTVSLPTVNLNHSVEIEPDLSLVKCEDGGIPVSLHLKEIIDLSVEIEDVIPQDRNHTAFNETDISKKVVPVTESCLQKEDISTPVASVESVISNESSLEPSSLLHHGPSRNSLTNISTAQQISSTRVQQVIAKIASWSKVQVHNWLKAHHMDKICPNLSDLDGEGLKRLALQYMHDSDSFYTGVKKSLGLSLFQTLVICRSMKELTDVDD